MIIFIINFALIIFFQGHILHYFYDSSYIIQEQYFVHSLKLYILLFGS